MSEKTIQIGGWDYTTTSCSSGYVPVFYFIPNYEFVSYVRINGTQHIPVFIEGTDIYDGSHWVRVDKQPYTEWHMGFLNCPFQNYPNHTGTVKLNMPSTTIRPLSCVLNDCC